MGIGMGLGAFADSFSRGVDMGNNFQDSNFKKQERERAVNQRNALDDVNKDARVQFDKGVEAGQYKPEQFMEFWSSYALPKLSSEMMLQGDYQGAESLRAWGEDAKNRSSLQTYGSALFKSAIGDHEGAMKDGQDLINNQGWMPGVNVSISDPMQDEHGNNFHRITFRGADGKTFQQDAAPQDMGKILQTFADPPAAYAAQQAARSGGLTPQQQQERDQKDREAAIKVLRERDKDAIGDAPTFDSLSAEDQQMAITKEIALQRGIVFSPQTTIVDTHTGKPVAQGLGAGVPQPQAQTPAAQPQPQAPTTPAPQGRSSPTPPQRPQQFSPAPASPAPQQPSTVIPASAPAQPSRAAGLTQPNAAPSPVQSRSQENNSGNEAFFNEARQAINQGGDPQQVGNSLMSKVRPQYWPEDLRQSTGLATLQY